MYLDVIPEAAVLALAAVGAAALAAALFALAHAVAEIHILPGRSVRRR